ncbi:hypothetical protein C8Q75DRAFT_125730 [Abortiporus biennis]|nr:hypothetical protein C8Q75DRAFT_125730 [Abortiporus biennis]
MRAYASPIFLLMLSSFLAPLWAIPLHESTSRKPEIQVSMEHGDHLHPMFQSTYLPDAQSVELYPRSPMPKVNKKALRTVGNVAKTADNVANSVASVAKNVPGPVGIIAKGVQIAHNVGHAIATGVKKVVGWIKNAIHKKKNHPKRDFRSLERREEVGEPLVKQESDKSLLARKYDFVLGRREEGPIQMTRRTWKKCLVQDR